MGKCAAEEKEMGQIAWSIEKIWGYSNKNCQVRWGPSFCNGVQVVNSQGEALSVQNKIILAASRNNAFIWVSDDSANNGQCWEGKVGVNGYMPCSSSLSSVPTTDNRGFLSPAVFMENFKECILYKVETSPEISQKLKDSWLKVNLGYNYRRNIIPRKTMELAAMASWGLLGFSSYRHWAQEHAKARIWVGYYQKDLFLPLNASQKCVAFLHTNKKVREGCRPHLPEWLKVLNSEVPPECVHIPALTQKETKQNKKSPHTNSQWLIRQSKQRIAQMSSTFCVFSFSVNPTFFHGSK